MSKRKAAPARESVWSIGLGYGHVSSSLLVIFPLFLAYELGLLVAPGANGVDFISRSLFAALDHSSSHYLLFHLGLAGAFLAILALLWRRGALALDQVTPMLLESAIYAMTLGSFIVFVMDRLVGLDLLVIGFARLAVESGELGSALVLSLGAGVHEELIFRLGLMGLGGMLLCAMGLRRSLALPVAVLASSVAFALAHHLGAAGEPFELSLFAYRLIAGLAFAAIFYYRSLAHAVYSHFLYDLYVLVIAQ